MSKSPLCGFNKRNKHVNGFKNTLLIFGFLFPVVVFGHSLDHLPESVPLGSGNIEFYETDRIVKIGSRKYKDYAKGVSQPEGRL